MPRLRRSSVVAALALVAIALAPASPDPAAARAGSPTLRVTTVADGFTIPWDLDFTADGWMLVTERPGAVTAIGPGGSPRRQLGADLDDLFAAGETGLMSIEVDPDFATNRRVYTCQGHVGPEVQVIAWQLDPGVTTLTRVADPLVGGIPSNGGRHGGCRVRVGPDGALWIATGDAALSSTPQDLTSLGGKVLRVDRFTGAGWPDNPFAASANPDTRRVYTYGHRNLQGLDFRPGEGEPWSVEHGTSRDDEVNRLRPGGNYGWQPGPGYDESVPMTDLVAYPDAIEAAWSSGFPTIATSGAAWLDGPQWGPWQGALAVATLKDRSLRIMTFDAAGAFTGMAIPAELDGTQGRLRTARIGPDGALYLTTSDGGGSDRVLRVTPADPPTALVPVAPLRLVDTRLGLGAPTGRLGARSTTTVDVAGRLGLDPVEMAGVVANITATESTTASFVTAWPADRPRPLASNLNTEPGQDTPNLTVVATDGGRFSLYNNAGATHLVVDIVGWFPTGAGFSAGAPVRLADTRADEPLGPTETRTATRVGPGATFLNVTTTGSTASSFVTVWPGGPRPGTSTLNTEPGQDTPNLTVVTAGAAGADVSVYNDRGTVDVVVDALGSLDPGSSLVGVGPTRLLDTRAGVGAPIGALGPRDSVELVVAGRGGVPAQGVDAVVLNLTSTAASAPTFVTAWPTGSVRPVASSLNTEPGQDVPNLVVVPVGFGGRVSLYAEAGAGHLVADVVAYLG